MPRPDPRQQMLAEWPEEPADGNYGPRASRPHGKRQPLLTPVQCEAVWEILAEHLHLRAGFGSRVQDFILAMNVDGGIRFDLAPYGVRAVFRMERGVGRVFSDSRYHELAIRAANAALRHLFSPHKAAA